MSQFQYTTVPGKLKPLFEKIRTVGVPPKATVQWLKSIGFTSSNDNTLLGILKFAGFCDGVGSPTSLWSQYRGNKHTEVMAQALKQGYSELFGIYPNAWQRTSTEIEHVFSTSSPAGKQAIGKAVSTFTALCELADFQSGGIIATTATDLHIEAGTLHMPVATDKPSVPQSRQAPEGPAVHIDIQIHIPPESSPDQIDQIFASMAKHLYKK